MPKNNESEISLFDKFIDSYDKFTNSEEYGDEFMAESKNLKYLWPEIKKEPFDRVPDVFVDWFANIDRQKLFLNGINNTQSSLWISIAQYLKEDDLTKKNQYLDNVASVLNCYAPQFSIKILKSILSKI